MTFYTALYLILALGIALGVSYYQYFYKTSYKGEIFKYLAALRAFTFFLIALLFINPKFIKKTYFVEKPNLVIVADNSQSITFLKETENVKDVFNAFKSDKALSDKFNIQSFVFGDKLIKTDSFSITDNQTKIAETLYQLNSLYNKNSAVVLITDGNQTNGDDYQYFKSSFPIYTLVVGDTSNYTDLKISQINKNDYTYVGNSFPVEVFLKYEGNKSIRSTFKISYKGKIIYSESVPFSKNKNSKTIRFDLKTKQTGVHQYKASIGEIDNEKNLKNNQAYFSITTLSEQSNILIISSINHPDIGMLKRSIESNKQRKVTVEIGRVNLENLKNYQLIILYQPIATQQLLFDEIRKNKTSYFIITGTKTDWNFLNKSQSIFNKKFIDQSQDYLPYINTAFNPFTIKDIGFNNFPPLKDKFGDISFKRPSQILLYQKIGTIATQQPLLATISFNNRKTAVLFGENIWKWRMASFTNTQNFEDFDNFLNTIIQYLIELKSKKQLKVDYKSVIYANEPIEFWVNFLDATKKFDSRAQLEIHIKNEDTANKNTFSLLLKSSYYYLKLPDLNSGNYSYTIIDKNSGISHKGKFRILNFPIEHQFYNADYKKLELLALNNSGSIYLLKNFNRLKESLRLDNDFKSIQKKKERISNLLSFKWLLLLIISSAVTEWFIRKNHGLI